MLKDRRGGRRDDFREGEIGDKSSDSRPVIDYKIGGNEEIRVSWNMSKNLQTSLTCSLVQR